MHKSEGDQIDPITWDRLKSIFGRQKPIRQVTQRQFDGFDDVLERLSRTPVESIDFNDLGCFYFDLSYQWLQPDLFAHIFPACLMDWHQSLLKNVDCAHKGGDFHSGIIRGDVLRKMLTSKQRIQVEAVFLDSMLYRMDRERDFIYSGSGTPAYSWIRRINTLAQCSNNLPEIWRTWWEVDTYGRAVCLLQYCSALIYLDGENPLFKPYSQMCGGGEPCLWESDCWHVDLTWEGSNLLFLRSFLTVDRVVAGVRAAATKLSTQPESKIAASVAADLHERIYVVESRISQLPDLLSSGDIMQKWWL